MSNTSSHITEVQLTTEQVLVIQEALGIFIKLHKGDIDLVHFLRMAALSYVQRQEEEECHNACNIIKRTFFPVLSEGEVYDIDCHMVRESARIAQDIQNVLRTTRWDANITSFTKDHKWNARPMVKKTSTFEPLPKTRTIVRTS